jgi:hypothetical protein
VSAQIRQLERELGHALLDRSGRVARLTEAGEMVLPFARAALGAVTGARLAVDELSGLLHGHVAVGMVSQVVADEPVVAAVSTDSDLAGIGSATVAELAAQNAAVADLGDAAEVVEHVPGTIGGESGLLVEAPRAGVGLEHP